MNVRERSAGLGCDLADEQRRRAWPGATGEDLPYVVSDAIANLLIYATTELAQDTNLIIERALGHAVAELGTEGDEPV